MPGEERDVSLQVLEFGGCKEGGLLGGEREVVVGMFVYLRGWVLVDDINIRQWKVREKCWMSGCI